MRDLRVQMGRSALAYRALFAVLYAVSGWAWS